jgi:hypothetical protein
MVRQPEARSSVRGNDTASVPTAPEVETDDPDRTGVGESSAEAHLLLQARPFLE